MKKIPEATRELVKQMYHGYCGHPGCDSTTWDPHHKMSDTKANCRRYPLFINSIYNLIPLCQKHHTENINDYRITDSVAWVCEEWLSIFKNG